MTTKLITKSAELLTEHGFNQTASIKDDYGINSTLFQNDALGRTAYMVVSKKYAYKQLASFQVVQVKTAKQRGLMLVFYEDGEQTFTVFDPNVVQQFGTVSRGDSLRANTEWLEIPMSYGASLEDHIAGVTPTLPGNQAQLAGF